MGTWCWRCYFRRSFLFNASDTLDKFCQSTVSFAFDSVDVEGDPVAVSFSNDSRTLIGDAVDASEGFSWSQD